MSVLTAFTANVVMVNAITSDLAITVTEIARSQLGGTPAARITVIAASPRTMTAGARGEPFVVPPDPRRLTVKGRT